MLIKMAAGPEGSTVDFKKFTREEGRGSGEERSRREAVEVCRVWILCSWDYFYIVSEFLFLSESLFENYTMEGEH